MRSFNLLNNAFDLNLSNQQNEARKLKFLLSLDSDILIVK
jgi:sensor histidine kinase regulating citrate/malate metabolism